jgi:NADH-quinone oxidoreductase subunit N
MYFEPAEDKSIFQAELDTRLVLSLNGVAVLALGIVPGWLLALCVSVIAQG